MYSGQHNPVPSVVPSRGLRYRNDPYSPNWYVIVQPAAVGHCPLTDNSKSLALSDSGSEYGCPVATPECLRSASNTSDQQGRTVTPFLTPTIRPQSQPALPSLERIDVGALPTSDFHSISFQRLKPGGDWVELCIGQLPFEMPSELLEALVRHCVPDTKVLRIAFQRRDARGNRSGLCFVTLRDNGAAQRVIATMNQAITFDVNCTALWARDEAAREELQRLSAWRRDNMDPERRGDGLPLSSMTVEWSRNPQNARRLKQLN